MFVVFAVVIRMPVFLDPPPKKRALVNPTTE